MRECVAGIYGNHYWMDLLRLSGWVLVSLFIGLGLRKPLIRVKDYIEEKSRRPASLDKPNLPDVLSGRRSG